MKSLRILHVEDSLLDAELLVLTLTDASIPCDVVRVETEQGLLAALDVEPFDLVISDLSLPSFDGKRALSIVRKKHPDIPFIFVSGTIGEEAAIESLLSGATDYVLKQKFSRLVPAVQRAYREAEEKKKRKQTERELALASMQLHHLFENLDDVFFSLDTTQGKLLQLSPSCERMTGHPFHAFLNDSQLWRQCLAAEDRGIVDDLESELRIGKSVRREFRVRHRDGTFRWVETRLKASIDNEGHLVRVDGVVSDISERKNAEDQIRVSEERYRRLFDGNPHAMWIYDAQSLRFLAVNDAAVRQYGYSREELLTMTVADLVQPGEVEQQADHKQILQHRRKNESVLDVEVASDEMPFYGKNARLALVTDITEKKKIQTQLLRTQRVESIGALSSGIAHDLNNILAPMLMGLQLLRTRISDEQNGKTIDLLETCTRRGADLVKQVLTFGRGVENRKGFLQIRHLLKDVRRILTETMPRSMQIVVDTPTVLWPVNGDSTQLHQLLMNLSINARDAMTGSGTLKLITRNETLDEEAAAALSLKPGPYVVLEVSDTGSGIPPEILDRIFDPFFTTKPIGEGTGLGLSTVRMIVDWHEGGLRVASQPNQGTTFTIHLPAIPGKEVPIEREPFKNITRGNGELVLVVDDEAAVCHIARETLEAGGYSVMTASNGVDGLELFKNNRGKVRAVVTDMNMPLMSGRDMVTQMQKMNPDLRCVTASGMPSKTPSVPADPEREFVLRKPYTADQLLEALATVLRGPS